MKEILISVIVPIYKVESYLEKCISSICNQSYTNLEIILVNDGSPDRCPEICDTYAKKDARIKVIHKNNGGLVSARKAGISIAKGDYITYVDGDDWIEPTMYQNMLKAFDNGKPDVVVEGFIHDINGKLIPTRNVIKPGLYTGEKLEAEIYSKMLYCGSFFNFGIYPAVWNKLYRRDLLLDFQMNVDEHISMGEDVACTYRCFMKADSICVLDSVHYHYRANPASIVGKYDPKYFEKMDSLFKYLHDTILKRNTFNLKEQFNYYAVFILLYGLRQEFSKNKNKFSEKISTLLKCHDNEFIAAVLKSINYEHIPPKDRKLLIAFSESNFRKCDTICKCQDIIPALKKSAKKILRVR